LTGAWCSKVISRQSERFEYLDAGISCPLRHAQSRWLFDVVPPARPKDIAGTNASDIQPCHARAMAAPMRILVFASRYRPSNNAREQALFEGTIREY
jgi:hypothetical protein